MFIPQAGDKQNMSFSKGDLFHIEMRNGIYQVLDFYKSDDKGNIYIFRKVFDGKLNFKVSVVFSYIVYFVLLIKSFLNTANIIQPHY